MELDDTTYETATEAERYVLGTMLAHPESVTEVRGVVSPEAFYRPAHEQIVRVIYDLHSAGEPTSPIAVSARLLDKGHKGEALLVTDLISEGGLAAEAYHHAQIVQREHIRRSGAAAVTRAMQLLLSRGDGAENPREVLALAVAEIEAVIQSADAGLDGTPEWREVIEATLSDLDTLGKTPGQFPGLTTGLRDLDAVMRGLREGALTVIAGRPAHGKSVLGANIGSHVAMNHGGVLFVSREMTDGEYGRRWLAAEGKVPFHAIQSPSTLDDKHWHKLSDATRKMDIPLWFDTTSESVAQIEAQALKRVDQARRGGIPLALIVVDYLQILSPPPGTAGNPTEAISTITRSLKRLAMKTKAHIIAISSLNRGGSPTDPPTMAELRGSGQIEFDADNVILLFNHGVADQESPRVGELDLNVAKVRGQQTSNVTVAWQGHYQRAVDLAL